MPEDQPVFLSYRREESRHAAGRLADWIGHHRVFIDVETIEPGADFSESVKRAVASCSVMLVLIGPMWTSIADRRGRRRLDDPDDLVVLEVATALQRGVRVFPILLDGAEMPTRDELPEPLAQLGFKQAIRVDYETFGSDVRRLLDVIGSNSDTGREPGYTVPEVDVSTLPPGVPVPLPSEQRARFQVLTKINDRSSRDGPEQLPARDLNEISYAISTPDEFIEMRQLFLCWFEQNWSVVITRRAAYITKRSARGQCWNRFIESTPADLRQSPTLVVLPFHKVSRDAYLVKTPRRLLKFVVPIRETDQVIILADDDSESTGNWLIKAINEGRRQR